MTYLEVGIGNPTFFSTEVERTHLNGDNLEYRLPGWDRISRKDFLSFYIRIQIGRRVFILDLVDGLKIGEKDYSALKILFGTRFF